MCDLSSVNHLARVPDCFSSLRVAVKAFGSDHSFHSTPSGSGPEALFKPLLLYGHRFLQLPDQCPCRRPQSPSPHTPARWGEQYFSELAHAAKSFALSGEEDMMQLTLGFIIIILFNSKFRLPGNWFCWVHVDAQTAVVQVLFPLLLPVSCSPNHRIE